jgi:NADP-dependent 3-hydroxy acid dehydrogenase YdfG
MKQIDKHAYGPWALVTGASSGIGEELAAGYEGIKGAVAEAIKVRLAAAQPAY